MRGTFETSSNAIAAGMARIVSDAFILRFHTEAMRWNTDDDDLIFIDFFERAKPGLDMLIGTAAARVHTLGGRSPQSIGEVTALCSIADSIDTGRSFGLHQLARDFRTLKHGCKLMATIAHQVGDRDTVRLLRYQMQSLFPLLRRLDQITAREA